MTEVSILAAGHRSIAGESPCWDPETGHLHCVDIIGRAILSLDLAGGGLSVTETSDFPTAVGLCRAPGKAAVALAGGVRIWTIGTDRFKLLVRLEDKPESNQLNEGAVSLNGDFWIGAMQANLDPDGSMRDMDRSSGAIHVVRPVGTTRRVTDHAYGISNTLAWDEECGRLIFGDTFARMFCSVAWPVEETGLARPTEWAATEDSGYPDGSCVDAEGYLWNARYAGGCMLRIAPDGSLDRKVILPANNIIACTFGGPGFATLYITTATNQLDEAALSNPHEGALLALDVGAAGKPDPRFGL